jgi:hypothetical protein
MFAEELHAAFEHFRLHRFPRPPDIPPGPNASPALWAVRLTPYQAARLDRAVALGARGNHLWSERDGP